MNSKNENQSKRETTSKRETRKQVSLPLSTILKQLNQHFVKLLSSNINQQSNSYRHVVMSHVEKVKVVLETLTIGIVDIEHVQTLDAVFEFWENLIFICRNGLINTTMEIIFKLLNECITMKTFHQMAILLLKKETDNKQMLSMYRKYKTLCRETYLVIILMFNRFISSIIGEEAVKELSKTPLKEEVFNQYVLKIHNVISTKELEVLLINLIAPIASVDRDVLHFIDNITENTFDPSKTICHYNPHFLLEFIGGKKMEKKIELEPCFTLILIYYNRFIFMIHFLPTWMDELKAMKVKEELIVKTNEYSHYKQWLYNEMGTNLRMLVRSRDTLYLSECIKGFLKYDDKKDLNELIRIIKRNTNMYDTRQMTRLAKLIESIMNHYIALQKGNVMLFDNDFNIDDFIQIFELSIAAEHAESMLTMLGITYATLPYFIGEARNTLLIKYFFEKRFIYFFFHWSDLIRNAFYHIILFRSLFVKEKNLIESKLSNDDLKQYSKRSTSSLYDPKNQDLLCYTALLGRLDMTQAMIDSVSTHACSLDESIMLVRYKEFQRVKVKHERWLNNKERYVSEIPKIQTSFFIDK